MEPKTLAFFVTQRPQAAGLFQAAIIKPGGILGQQHQRLGGHPLLGGLRMRLQQTGQRDLRAAMPDQSIGRLGRSP